MSNSIPDTKAHVTLKVLGPETDEYENEKQEDDNAVTVFMDVDLIYMYCDDAQAKFRIMRKIRRLRKQGWSLSGGIHLYHRGAERYPGYYVTMTK